MEGIEKKCFDVVKKCQEILAEWIVPDSTISDHGVLSRLLGILDDSQLVREMKESEPINEKYWNGSANVARTKYYPEDRIFELEYGNGKIYHYYDFPAKLWLESFNALSIGSFLQRKVKGNHRYCKVK